MRMHGVCTWGAPEGAPDQRVQLWMRMREQGRGFEGEHELMRKVDPTQSDGAWASARAQALASDADTEYTKQLS